MKEILTRDPIAQLEMIKAASEWHRINRLLKETKIEEMHDGFTWNTAACSVSEITDQTLDRIYTIDKLIEEELE